jgi:hypothetical protein
MAAEDESHSTALGKLKAASRLRFFVDGALFLDDVYAMCWNATLGRLPAVFG